MKININKQQITNGLMLFGMGLLMLYPEMVYAVSDVDDNLKTLTEKIIGAIKGNLIPVLSTVGVVLGLYQTYQTQTGAPLVICGGGGLGGGLLLDYINSTFPCIF